MLSAAEIIESFFINKSLKKYLPSLVEAALLHKNSNWIKALLTHEKSASFFRDSQYNHLKILDIPEREHYAQKILIESKRYFHEIVQILKQVCQHYWSLDFTRAFANRIANETYAVRREWYQSLAIYMHKDIIYELENLTPADDYRKVLWREASKQICEAIVLREEIRQVFETQ